MPGDILQMEAVGNGGRQRFVFDVNLDGRPGKLVINLSQSGAFLSIDSLPELFTDPPV